jgi:hypothetical protein
MFICTLGRSDRQIVSEGGKHFLSLPCDISYLSIPIPTLPTINKRFAYILTGHVCEGEGKANKPINMVFQQRPGYQWLAAIINLLLTKPCSLFANPLNFKFQVTHSFCHPRNLCYIRVYLISLLDTNV